MKVKRKIIVYKNKTTNIVNDNYKLYFDRTVLTDIHIQLNRPDIIILNKQQKQAYLLDIAVPNSHNITQTYKVGTGCKEAGKKNYVGNISGNLQHL
jgi:hypothetical protein